MNTFKTIVVVGMLLCVGYGAHVVMNKPISNQPLDIADRVWDDLIPQKPDVDLDPSNSLVPELPPLGPAPQSATSSLAVPGPVAAPETPAAIANADSGQSIAAVANQTAPPLSSMGPPMAQLAPIPPDQNSTPAGTATAVSPATSLSALPQTAGPPAGFPLNGTPQVVAPEYPSSTWSNGFEEMWDSVQLKLQSNQLVDALLAVSLFYNDEELTDEQRERMISLLDQLAGTVIYAADFHLEPAHAAQPGETLQSIAATYQVPAELLSRINGVTEATLQPGQELKVLRGPFRGELSVADRELTLFLGRYYAGRFSVGVGRDLPAQVGSLEVADKAGAKAFVDRRTGQELAAGTPENPYGGYWIGLRDSSSADYAFLGIHGTGSAVDASDTRGCISVSDEDANDLQAILSIGSKISMQQRF